MKLCTTRENMYNVFRQCSPASLGPARRKNTYDARTNSLRTRTKCSKSHQLITNKHRALSCRLGPRGVRQTSGCVHIFEERICAKMRQMARKHRPSTATQAHTRQDNSTSYLHDDSLCSAVSFGFCGRPQTRRCAHALTDRKFTRCTKLLHK